MKILDHLPISGTSQLRHAMSPIRVVWVIEVLMPLAVVKTVLLKKIILSLFPIGGCPTTRLGPFYFVHLN